ncbi:MULTISPECIES: hypothetical protein [Brevibacillus]|uniref:hypothetical protein n=1 Tax=Brevibacillus TaxID=55080 RepID=UPI000EEFD699|nr:hypothetical protein [Brevibacillus sp.]HBZ83236.1 hypothetical protein [Brevibacillus sp.]
MVTVLPPSKSVTTVNSIIPVLTLLTLLFAQKVWQAREEKKMSNSKPTPYVFQEGGESIKEETQADLLIRIGHDYSYLFHDPSNEAYAEVCLDGRTRTMKVKSKDYSRFLLSHYYKRNGKSPSPDSVNQAQSQLEAEAIFDGNQHELCLRIGEHNNNFYYNLNDEKSRVIEISPGDCKVIDAPPLFFISKRNMKAQAMPDFSGDVRRILKHIRLKRNTDKLLYLVYLISCLIPDIPHPVLVFFGEKGAAKSTSMRMTKEIIDPAISNLLSMPRSTSDLALSLHNNYMTSFDNLTSISTEQSNLLCTAVTGGTITKRKLYSDDEEAILSFKGCVTLNGINVVATKADLIDRSIILELDRVDENERKEERLLWEQFERDKPFILGGAMKVLSKAIEIYPNVHPEWLPRMADFTRWGYAITEAMGFKGEYFLKAYKVNQIKANEEAISTSPVAEAIVALMSRTDLWHGTVTDLLHELEKIAKIERIDTHSKEWPGAPHSLSRRVKEIRSNLQEKDIFIDIRHGGKAKMATITRNRETELDADGNSSKESEPSNI